MAGKWSDFAHIIAHTKQGCGSYVLTETKLRMIAKVGMAHEELVSALVHLHIP